MASRSPAQQPNSLTSGHVVHSPLSFTLDNDHHIPMPSTLDHKYYPHLMESIVLFAPLGALIPLRATCKSLQTMVDPILFRHVQLHAFRGTQGGRVLGLTLPGDTEIEHSSRLPRLPWVPRAVIVLDHPGTFGQDDRLLQSVSLRNFSSLTTFRRLHRSEVAERMADARISGVHTAVEYIDSQMYATIVPPAPRRLVMNIRGDPTSWGYFGKTLDVVSSKTVREYVVIFWPALPDESFYFAAIFDIVYPAWREDDYESVTVVGLETLCDLGTAADSAEDREHAAGIVRERMRRYYYERNPERWGDYYRRSIVDPLCARIRFVRRDDWTAELGEERAEEGKWIQPRRQ